MKTPIGIKITTVLMSIVIFLHLVAAAASDLPRKWTASRGLFAYSGTVFGVVVVGLGLVFAESLVLWFYWKHRNWARWLVLLGCLLCFVSLRHFIVGPSVSHGRTVIIIYRIAVAVTVMAYLITPQGRAYFARDRKLQS